MLLNEILGLPRGVRKQISGYGCSHYNKLKSTPVGRPVGSTENKLKPRPNKNLWFTNDQLWYQDLDLYNAPGSLKLISDENEEQVILAVDRDTESNVFGKWDIKSKKGITYKKPKHFQHVAPVKAKFKDFFPKK